MEEEKEDIQETILEDASGETSTVQVEGAEADSAVSNGEEESEHTSEPPLTDEELSDFIERLCISKAEEFHMLGYPNATGEEVWACVNQTYMKQGVPLLHQIVNDILSLKVTTFMNALMMEAYRDEPRR